ncbi:hypothetical protein ATANTOWER_010268 [Ataeniobius toweri]|uniref:Uncharacterized protein n=1 Tax=Ataeniobius toweri TaxID=208326 RepID=A0ABU7BVK0_9TELE|nr:hypothetical protein [Ataeniobius toweri]
MLNNMNCSTAAGHQVVSQSFCTTSSIVGCGGAGAYFQQSMGETWTGRQSIAEQHRDTQDKLSCTHSFTPKGNVETNQPNSHVFGLWEEAGVPGENPHKHGKNM